MVSELKYKQLVGVYSNLEHAPLYFEELSLLKSPKPNIDIERRRASINLRHKIKLPIESANAFFYDLECLGLGTLTLITDRRKGNSKFKWTEVEDDVVSMAKEVIKRAKPSQVKPPSEQHYNNFILSTKKVIQLSLQETEELYLLLKEVYPTAFKAARQIA